MKNVEVERSDTDRQNVNEGYTIDDGRQAECVLTDDGVEEVRQRGGAYQRELAELQRTFRQLRGESAPEGLERMNDHRFKNTSQSAMTIALWRPTDGLSKFKMFALIDDGEVVKGEFHPPRDADLLDEESLLDRFNGPGAVASQFENLEDEALKRAETAPELEGVDELGGTTTQVYRCTMCGSAPKNPQTTGDERRWMACPECEKDRFFEPIDGDRR